MVAIERKRPLPPTVTRLTEYRKVGSPGYSRDAMRRRQKALERRKSRAGDTIETLRDDPFAKAREILATRNNRLSSTGRVDVYTSKIGGVLTEQVVEASPHQTPLSLREVISNQERFVVRVHTIRYRRHPIPQVI